MDGDDEAEGQCVVNVIFLFDTLAWRCGLLRLEGHECGVWDLFSLWYTFSLRNGGRIGYCPWLRWFLWEGSSL